MTCRLYEYHTCRNAREVVSKRTCTLKHTFLLSCTDIHIFLLSYVDKEYQYIRNNYLDRDFLNSGSDRNSLNMRPQMHLMPKLKLSSLSYDYCHAYI